MAFFKKFSKIVKENLDVDIEKEAKELLSGSLNELKDSLSKSVAKKTGIIEETKGILGGLKGTLNGILDNKSISGSPVSSKPSANNSSSIHRSQSISPKSTEDLKAGSKVYTGVRNTQMIMLIAEHLKEKAVVNKDGDVEVQLSKANGIPFNWHKIYRIFPDSITVESFPSQYPKNFNAERFLGMLRQSTGFTKLIEGRLYNDNTISLYAEINSEEFEELWNKILDVTMKMHAAYQIMAESIETHSIDSIGHDSSLIFSTEMLSKMFESAGIKHKIDEDGDIKVEYSKANGKSLEWFVWYIISPNSIKIDSGCNELPEKFDVENFRNQLESFKGSLSKMIRVKETKNGSMRLQTDINAMKPEEFVDKWSEIITTLENLWSGIYDVVKFMEQEEARRRQQEEAARHRQEEEEEGDDDDDNSDDVEDEDNARESKSSWDPAASIYRPWESNSSRPSSSGKKKDMKIVSVERGCVVIKNQYGGQVRAPFHPSSGGDAVFADYNSDMDRIVVTTERGVVGIYNTSGGQINSFTGSYGSAVAMARWQGNDLLVKLKDGSQKLTSTNGGIKRHL